MEKKRVYCVKILVWWQVTGVQHCCLEQHTHWQAAMTGGRSTRNNTRQLNGESDDRRGKRTRRKRDFSESKLSFENPAIVCFLPVHSTCEWVIAELLLIATSQTDKEFEFVKHFRHFTAVSLKIWECCYDDIIVHLSPSLGHCFSLRTKLLKWTCGCLCLCINGHVHT